MPASIMPKSESLPSLHLAAPSSPSFPSSSSVGFSSASPYAGRIRAPVACGFCRHRKIRCSGGPSACANCVRTKRTCSYEEVSEETNRAVRERKALLRVVKIQSLGLIDTGVAARAAVVGAPRMRRADSSSIASPKVELELEGWTPEVSAPAASAAPSTPSPYVPSVFASTKPFPSVLASIPVEGARAVKMSRSKSSDLSQRGSEDRTFASLSFLAGPRRMSNSPPVETRSAPVHVPGQGFTSYFPGRSSSSDDDSSADLASPAASPSSSYGPWTPEIRRSTSYGFSSSFSPSGSPTSASHSSFSPQSPFEFDSFSPSVISSPADPWAPSFQADETLTPLKSHGEQASYFPSSHFDGSASAGLVGLGLGLPFGFAEGMPGRELEWSKDASMSYYVEEMVVDGPATEEVSVWGWGA